MRRPLVVFFILFTTISIQACNECGDPFWETCVEEVHGQVGCYAASAGEANQWGNVGISFDNPYYDQKMGEEVIIQRAFFSGIPAAVYVLNEGGVQYKNAYASPDGNIYFGYHMFYYTIANYNELAAAGILAHEWGHRTQFVHQWPRQVPYSELEADAFSGYYMALRKAWAWNQIQGYYANVYALGDYYFNSPNHHGTHEQRLAAAYLGVNTAILAVSNNRPFSYVELHQIFSQQINLNIVGRKEPVPASSSSVLSKEIQIEIRKISEGKSTGKEVVYPRKLTPENIEQLKPSMSK